MRRSDVDCMSPVVETKQGAMLRSTSFTASTGSLSASSGPALSGYAYEPLFQEQSAVGRSSAFFSAASPTFTSLLNSRSGELGHKFAAQVAYPGGSEQRTISPLMLTPLRPSSRELGLGAPFTLASHGADRRPRRPFKPSLEKPALLGRLVVPTPQMRLQKPATPMPSKGAGSPAGPWDTRSLGGPRQFASGPPPPPSGGVRWQLRASEGLAAGGSGGPWWHQLVAPRVVR